MPRKRNAPRGKRVAAGWTGDNARPNLDAVLRRRLHALGHELLVLVALEALRLRVEGRHLVVRRLLLVRQAVGHERLALVALLVRGLGVARLHALLLRV